MRLFDSSRIPQAKGYEDFRFPRGFSSHVLEIGAGAGWNAVTYARMNPSHCVVAVEHSRERFALLEGRATRSSPLEMASVGMGSLDEVVKASGLTNLFPVHADAESFVVHNVASESLDRVMLLYPNPYPKASQANKRWHNMPFMSELLAKMKSGAVLQMATNEDFYAAEFFERAIDTWKLVVVSNERVTLEADPDFRPRTHFEKKYYSRGEMLHLMEFRKV